MSNKPLAYRLGIYISVAVTIVYAAFILWAYNYNYILLKQEVENEALVTSGKISNLVSEMVISTQQVAGNIAWQANFYKSEGETGNFLRMLMQRFPHIKVIQIQLNDLSGINGSRFYVASYKDSSFVFSDNNSRTYACFDLATQSSLLPDSSHPGWSEPYKNESFEGVFSAYYLPFQFFDQFENEEISGYIICEASLQYFQEMIEKTKIGERGFAFLTSAKGTYMTHPIKEMVMNRTIHNLPDKVFPYDSAFREKFIKGLTGPATVYPTPLNYEKSWSYPIKILENDWLLAFTLPTAELYQELRYLLLKMIGVSLVVIALVFFIVFTISSRIMQPLSQISSELHNFSSDQPSTMQGGINELQTLQESLIRLQKMYDSFKKREHESNLGKARINAELAAASEVQQSIIPRIGTHNFIDFGITVHSVFEPANIVSGDLYDFFPIDEKRLLITIGDVSGGGVPAALFMGVAHTLIKSNAPIGSAKDIVYLVNKELCKNNSNQFFLSLFLGIIDTDHRTLNYCNAGHTPTFVLSESGHVRELSNPHGLPLGLYSERPYKDSKIHLEHSDTIIMYTDGISEQLDSNGKFFGVEGLVKLFDIIRGQHPENMAGTIIRSVTDFAGDTPFVDDLTLLIVKLDEA